MKSNVLSNKWHSSVHSGMEFAMGRLSVLLCMLLVTTVAGWAGDATPANIATAEIVSGITAESDPNTAALTNDQLTRLTNTSNDQVIVLLPDGGNISNCKNFILDLGREVPVAEFDAKWEGAYPSKYKIFISSNKTEWVEAANITGNSTTTTSNAINQNGRYLKVVPVEAMNPNWGIKVFNVSVKAYPTSTGAVDRLWIYAEPTAVLGSDVCLHCFALDLDENGENGKVVMNPGTGYQVNVNEPDGNEVTNHQGNAYHVSKLGEYTFTYAGPNGLSNYAKVNVTKDYQKLALSEDMVWIEEGSRMTGVANAFDNNYENDWEIHTHPGNRNYETGFVLDLKGTYDVQQIITGFEASGPEDYTIGFSTDGKVFTTATTVTGRPQETKTDYTFAYTPEITGVRYVQFHCSKPGHDYGVKIRRFDIMAAKVESAVDDHVGPTVGTEVPVAGKTSADITVTATDDSGEYVYYKLEQVAPASGPTITDRFTSMRSGEAATFTLTGLTAETVYRFHVTAYDVFGNATTLEDVEFKTLGTSIKAIQKTASVKKLDDLSYTKGTATTGTPTFIVLDDGGVEIQQNDPKLQIHYVVISNQQGIINTTGLSTEPTLDNKPYNTTGTFTLDTSKTGTAVVRIYGIYTDDAGTVSYSDDQSIYYINVYDSTHPLTVTSFKIGDTTYDATSDPSAFSGTSGSLKTIINNIVGRVDAYLDVEDLHIEGTLNSEDVRTLRRMGYGSQIVGHNAIKTRIFVKTINGDDRPWLYVWDSNGNKLKGDYPGTQMGVFKTAEGYYVMEFETTPVNIVISKNAGEFKREYDFTNLSGDNYFIYDSKNVNGGTYHDVNYYGALKTLDLANANFHHDGGAYVTRWYDNTNTLTGFNGEGDIAYNIEAHMFQDCDGLETVILPNTEWRDKFIGQYAFYGCDELKNLTLPDDLKDINGYAFEKCRKLEELTLPSQIETLGYDAFRDCNNLYLNTPQLPNSINHIDDFAFAGTSVSEVILPANPAYTKVFTNVFGWCNLLTDVTIPSNVTSIGGGAFNTCPILEHVTIEGTITEILDEAFSTDPQLPSSVANRLIRDLTVLNNGVFQNCTSITELNIPATVTTLKNRTFANCTSLTSLTVNSATAPSGYTLTNGEMKNADNNSTDPFNNIVPNNVTITFAGDAVEGYASYRSGTKQNNAFKRLLTKALSENTETYNCVVQQHADVELVRTFKTRWNTIALPFALPASKVASMFGEGTKVAYYADWTKAGSDATDDVLMFYTTTYTGGGEADWQKPNKGMVDTEDGMSQTRPYIIMLEDGETSDNIALPAAGFYLAEDVDLVYGTNGDETHKPVAFKNKTAYGSTYAFKGTLNKINSLAAEEGVNVLYIKNNEFWTRTTDSANKTSLKPFRGYFTFPTTAGAKDNNILLVGIMDNDNTTAIDHIDGEEVVNVTVVDGVYDLSGRKVYDRPNATMKPGVYIVNGKKMIVK